MKKMIRQYRTLGRWTVAAGAALVLSFSTATVALADEEPSLTPQEHKAISGEYIICAGCHKIDGRGGPGYGGYAANLHETILTHEELVDLITKGRRDRGMPTFKGVLSENQIELMATYIEVEFKGKPVIEKEKP